MTDQPSDPVAPQGAKPGGGPTAAQTRDLRRKAALKANMARRKAQVRGRDQAADTGEQPDNDTRNE